MAETKPTRTNWSLADRALVWLFVQEKGLPEWAGDDQIGVFAKVAGVSEQEACAAFAEIEDKGLAGREESNV